MNYWQRFGKTFPVLVILFPFFFALHGFIENFYIIPFEAVVRIFFKYLVLSVLLYLLFLFIYNNRLKALGAFFLTSLVYYFFGFFYDVVHRAFSNNIIGHYRFLLPLTIVFYVAMLVLIARKLTYAKWNFYLNILLIL